MSTDVALPTQFKDLVRERILSMFMDLIPKDEIDNLVEKEIKAFFETEALLTVTQTQIEIDNPMYDSTRNSGYGNERRIKRECLAFGSKMTPFRQLVWSTLHQALQPALIKALTDENSQVKSDFDDWVTLKATPDLLQTNKALFTHLATNMSAMMLRQVLNDAVNSAQHNLVNSLQMVGINPTSLPTTAPPVYRTGSY